MGKVIIRVDPLTGQNYFSRVIREDGFVGEIEGLANAMTITFFKPGAKLTDVEESLGIILEDIALRKKKQADKNPKKKGGQNKARLSTRQGVTAGRHPLFIKYNREWLSKITGYSKGYLCRIATGGQPLSRSFIERVCFKLNQPEAELFFNAARGYSSHEGSEGGQSEK